MNKRGVGIGKIIAVIFIILLVLVIIASQWSLVTQLPIIGNIANFTQRMLIGEVGREGLNTQIGESKGIMETFAEFFGLGDTVNADSAILDARLQTKQVWEGQYAAGQQSKRATSIQFGLREMSVTPYFISGWQANEEVAVNLKVENEGNIPLNITTYFECTAPKTPVDICEIAGITFNCGQTNEYVPNLNFSNIPAGAPDSKLCPHVLIGTNDNCDLCNTANEREPCERFDNRLCWYVELEQAAGEPLSWCHTIIDEGGDFGLFSASIMGYGEADFMGNARLDVTVIDRNYAGNLLASDKLTFVESKAVNTENPVSISMTVGKIPLLSEELENSNVKIIEIAFRNVSDGDIMNIDLFSIQVPKELIINSETNSYFEDVDNSEEWDCTLTGDIESIIPETENDRIEYLKDSYELLGDDYTICVLKEPEARQRYVFRIKTIDSSVQRSNYLIGADIAYTYRKQFSSPVTLQIDCTCSSYKSLFGDNRLYDCED